MSATVRPATTDDAPAIATIYGELVTGSVATFEEVPPTAEEVARRMLVAPRRPWLVAEEDGVVLGYAYAAPLRERAAYRWSVTVSVYLSAEARGRGVGRALYARLLPELAGLGFVRAAALITQPNPASVRLHEAMGFTRSGLERSVGHKLGAWRDVGVWEVLLVDPPPVDPPEPRPWTT